MPHHQVVQNLSVNSTNIIETQFFFYNIARTCMKYHYGGCRIPIQMNYLSIYLSIYEYNYTDTIKLGVLIYRVITHRLKRK